jgi:hypothetical protein
MSTRSLLLAVVLLALFAVPRCTCGSAPTPECTEDVDCEGNDVCLFPEDGEPLCARQCGAEVQCDVGTACVENTDGSFACAPIVDERGIGEACDEDTQCTSGACVGDDENVKRCVVLCTEDTECGDGELCYVVDQRKVCLEPLDDRAAGDACSTPRECASARCAGVPPDEDAPVCLDGCVPEDGCAGERGCVPLNSGGHVCVALLADGETCFHENACENGRCVTDVDESVICTGPCGDDAPCADDWLCLEDAEGAPICLPKTDTKAALAACESARECASGHCGNFQGDTLCADPCDENDGCVDENTVCWTADVGTSLCGPIP